jgi:hypothetical protein
MKKIIFFGLIILLAMNYSFAWDDCPYGLINDPFPGECSKYIDTNNNNICDHSEKEPVNNTTATEVKQVPHEYIYDLFILLGILLPIYLSTYILHLKGIIKRRPFYKIWNISLTISFILVSITSVLSMLGYKVGFWHIELGIIMMIVSVFHIHLYWKQFKRGV